MEIDDRSAGLKMGFSDNEIAFEVAEHPVECAGCGVYGESKQFDQCPQCKENFCSTCSCFVTTHNMRVCWWCGRDIELDEGVDLETLLGKVEYEEDR